MRARKGFTLVELLIVMAIIAALLAVLVPIASGAMERAKVTKIAVRMRNVEQGAEQYLLSEMPDNPSTTDAVEYTGTDYENDKITLTFATNTTGEIGIKVECTADNASMADKIANVLIASYGEDRVSTSAGNKVTLISTVTKFW